MLLIYNPRQHPHVYTVQQTANPVDGRVEGGGEGAHCHFDSPLIIKFPPPPPKKKGKGLT